MISSGVNAVSNTLNSSKMPLNRFDSLVLNFDLNFAFRSRYAFSCEIEVEVRRWIREVGSPQC